MLGLLKRQEAMEQGVLIPAGARRPRDRRGNCILSVMKYFRNVCQRGVIKCLVYVRDCLTAMGERRHFLVPLSIIKTCLPQTGCFAPRKA